MAMFMLNITTATSRTRIRRRARQRSSTITFILCFPVAVSRTFRATGTINDGNDCGESDEGYRGDDEGLINEPILIFWSFGDSLRGSTWNHAHSGPHCDDALAVELRSVERVWKYVMVGGDISRIYTTWWVLGRWRWDVTLWRGWMDGPAPCLLTLKQWHYRTRTCSDPRLELPQIRKWC